MSQQQQVREWWNRNPMSYDVDEPIAHPRGSPGYFREIDSRIFHPRVFRLATGPDGRPFSRFVDFDAVKGKDVLEVGCGSGIAAQIFVEAGARLTAVDLTDWAVETTRLRLEAFGLEGTVLQGDAQELPFEDESFDVVFSWGVIMMTSDMDRALSELIRVCKPGGELVLMLYNRHSLFFPVYRGLARFLPLARRLGLHFEGARAGEREGLIVRHFTPAEVRRMLESRGISVRQVQPYGQDSELLPLPRKIRVPITDRLPLRFKDYVLNRLGHQIAATGIKRAVV